MWGCEAVAVRHDGRANPQQLMMTPRRRARSPRLREALVAAHRERFGAVADDDLLVGLQLTHSGRFARPDVYDRPAPLTASVHPILDRRFPDGVRLLEDDDLERLVADFVAGREARARAPGSPSSTSSTATAISVTSCSGRAVAAGTIRRVAREPHSLHARDHRGHPRGSARPDDRRAALGVRHGAVPARTAWHRRAGSRRHQRLRVRRARRRRAWTRRSTTPAG